MQRRFVTNLGFLVFINLLIKPLWIFGIDRTVQNQVSSADYGIYFVLLNFSMLPSVILDLGISNFNNRSLAQKPDLLNHYFGNLFTLKFLLIAIYMVATFAAAFFSGYTLHEYYILFFLVINMICLYMILFIRSAISARQYFRTDSMLSVSDKFLMLFTGGSTLLYAYLHHVPYEIEWFVYSQTSAYLVALLIAWIVFRRLTPDFKFNVDWKMTRQLIQLSYPFAILILLMTLYQRLDSILLEKLLAKNGDAQAGIYASAYRLMDALNQFGFLFATLLLPMFSRMLGNKEPINDMVKTGFTLIYIFSFSIAMSIIFYRMPIMTSLYHKGNSFSADILGFLMVSFIFVCTNYVFGTLLTASGHLKTLNWIALIAVATDVIFNLILIPRLMAKGTAITSLITQCVVSVLQIIFAFRFLKLRLDYKFIFILIVFSGSVFLINYFSYYLSVDWKIKFILVNGISIIVSVTLGLVPFKKIISLLRQPQF
jgi:O-antigen/teichoic acid export membrane protein